MKTLLIIIALLMPRIPEDTWEYDYWKCVHGKRNAHTIVHRVGNQLTIRIEPHGWYHYKIEHEDEIDGQIVFTLMNVSGSESFIALDRYKARWITQWNEEIVLKRVAVDK